MQYIAVYVFVSEHVSDFVFSASPAACHSSCAACAGPSATQCSLCPGSLVLHQGQCIPSCGEGFYPQHGVCKGRNYRHNIT